MTFDFAGKRAVVCGGAAALAAPLRWALRRRARRCRSARAAPRRWRRRAGEIASFGHLAHAGVCDLAEGEEIRGYISEASEALGGIDILVNNASGLGMVDDEAGWAATSRWHDGDLRAPSRDCRCCRRRRGPWSTRRRSLRCGHRRGHRRTRRSRRR